MISYIVLVIISYLLGNISTSTIIAKKMFNVDIRTQGSGNPGSTNVLRTLGKKAGAMTFAGDLLKGLVAVLIARGIAILTGIDEVTAAYVAVIAVVSGHNWPISLGFKGGKGVATSLGAMIGMNPVIALSCFGIFLVIVAITRYVSLGSIVGIAASPLFMIATQNKKGIVVTLFLTISVIYTHRENIKRLINGTERKIGAKK